MERRDASSRMRNRMGEEMLYGRLPTTRTAFCRDGRAGSRSTSSTSPAMIDAFAGSVGASSAIRSRSISMAASRDTRGARRSVSIPGPAPISRNESVGAGEMASTTLSAHTGSRKCCPNRLRVRTIEIAIVAHHALIAERLRFTNAAAMENERIRRFGPFRWRQSLTELLLHLDGIIGGSDADAVRNA